MENPFVFLSVSKPQSQTSKLRTCYKAFQQKKVFCMNTVSLKKKKNESVNRLRDMKFL